MESWIAEFFQCGHSLESIYNMPYSEYESIVASLSSTRKKQPRTLRPVQINALKKAKELNK